MEAHKRITLDDALKAFEAQGVPQNDYAAVCPTCGTVQSMNSLVRAGAKKEDVHRFFAFSCEGRFSGAGPWTGSDDRRKAARARRKVRGCDWTLGGLFPLNKVTLVYPDGREKPSFEVATSEQARALAVAFDASATA